MFQKGIGPDMFSWIRHYVAEVCALPSALPVGNGTSWRHSVSHVPPDVRIQAISACESSRLQVRCSNEYLHMNDVSHCLSDFSSNKILWPLHGLFVTHVGASYAISPSYGFNCDVQYCPWHRCSPIVTFIRRITQFVTHTRL